jgi:hypothetical protein
MEPDCTKDCKLIQHGNNVTKVLTKHEISEEKLIKYLVCTCKNFSLSRDENVSRKNLFLAKTGFYQFFREERLFK